MERIRPAAQQADRGPSPSPSSSPRPAAANSRSSLSSKILVIVLIVAGLALLGGMALWLMGGGTSNAVKKDQYQAVFLTNGQVYFGKLDNINSGYVTLEDIYYLQVTQQQDGQLQEGDNDASADPQISLAKLGNELHGPEDSMYISRDQVLFWENLKTDGDVVTAINNYQTGGEGENQNQ